MPFLALTQKIAMLLFRVCKNSYFKLWELEVQCTEHYWSVAPALLSILYFSFTLQERCVHFHASISLQRKQVIRHSAGGRLGTVTCWLRATRIWKPRSIFAASVLLRCTSQPHAHGNSMSIILIIQGPDPSSDLLEQLSSPMSLQVVSPQAW